jgi:hypothetical protein
VLVLAEVAELNADSAALSIDDPFGSRFGFGAGGDPLRLLRTVLNTFER